MKLAWQILDLTVALLVLVILYLSQFHPAALVIAAIFYVDYIWITFKMKRNDYKAEKESDMKKTAKLQRESLEQQAQDLQEIRDRISKLV